MTIRIAMWSGPRNISTAMMRSWENRADCEVVDEPFYAFYLSQTQSPHPLFDEVIASQSKEYDEVSKQLSEGHCTAEIQYQKHMTHHMLDGIDLAWTKDIRHCFLIRDPREVVNSYTNSRGVCTAKDIGIIRQAELYDEISQISGQTIPVVDSSRVLGSPATLIPKICEALNVPYSMNMLKWPEGPRESDGIWAKHWYHSVEKSTGFAFPKPTNFELTSEQNLVVEEVMPHYRKMQKMAL